jgi:hypothetical protein
MPTIRPSRDDDIDAITLIYAHHVLHGTGTFEVDPPSVQDMRARRAEVLARGLPWLVAESDNQVSGFAYCNWFKPRPAAGIVKIQAQTMLPATPQRTAEARTEPTPTMAPVMVCVVDTGMPSQRWPGTASSRRRSRRRSRPPA